VRPDETVAAGEGGLLARRTWEEAQAAARDGVLRARGDRGLRRLGATGRAVEHEVRAAVAGGSGVVSSGARSGAGCRRWLGIIARALKRLGA